MNKNFDSKLFDIYLQKIRSEDNSIKKENLLKSVLSWINWLKDNNKLTIKSYEKLSKQLNNVERTYCDLHYYEKGAKAKSSVSSIYIYIIVILYIFLFLIIFYLFTTLLKLKVEISSQDTIGRVLPFKGVIKETSGQPMDTKRDAVFKIYSSSAGGSPLYVGTCLGESGIEPTHNGNFNILIGSDCGMDPISEDIFKNNSSLFLGVVIGAEPEFTPRYQIITSTFSKDTNKLQGMSVGNNVLSIPFINKEGSIDIANESPTINSTNGLFTLQGAAVTIRSTKEGGNIIFDTALGSDVIIPTGKVGIGTFSPVSPIDITSASILTTIASISNLTKEDTQEISVLDLSLGSPVNGTNAQFIEFFAEKDETNKGVKVGAISLNNGGVVYETSGADFAEYFEVDDPTHFKVAQIVSLSNHGINPSRTGEKAIGVVSNSAGYIGNNKYESKNSILVGLVGQVDVLVSNSNGEIVRGDTIGLSDIPGYGAKQLDGNSQVGYAIENAKNVSNENCESSLKGKLTINNELITCGLVKVIINLD